MKYHNLQCRFCSDKVHSEKCGKCKPCCDADGWVAVNMYHPRAPRKKKVKS